MRRISLCEGWLFRRLPGETPESVRPDALPEDGLSVFLNDDGIVYKLYEKTGKPKMLAGKEGGDAWAGDVSPTEYVEGLDNDLA